MGMTLMPINTALIKKMTNEQLVKEFNQSRQNIGLELLRMGAILTERKTRSHEAREGNFEQIIKQEFNFSPSRGFLLMKAWKERDSYIEKLHSSGVNYKQLESILLVPAEDRADFIEREHPESLTAREAMQAARDYKALKAELEAEKKARADAESKNAELEGRAMETEQRAQTEVADVKYRIRMLKTNHEQERNDLTKRAQTAEAELNSLKIELLHKQSEVDALKHEQKMQTEPQVVEIPDTASREEIARLRDQLAQSRKTVERQEARAASAEKSLAYQMERASKAQAELQALKNGMSLQVYAEEHKEFSQYQKSADEEYKTASLARKWLSNVFNCPNTEPELREWIRCLIKMHEDKQEAILSIRDDVDSAIKKLQIFHDVLAGACGVRRVK